MKKTSKRSKSRRPSWLRNFYTALIGLKNDARNILAGFGLVTIVVLVVKWIQA